MSLEKFAFVLHPLQAKDLGRKFSLCGRLPDGVIERVIRHVPSFKASHITGIRSPHAEAEGWFMACPLTSRQMMELPEAFVLNRIIQAGKAAEKLGAKILGLGAFTSIVGDAGITIANNLNIAVTTGNSYTVATALQGTRRAAQIMDVDLRTANVLVLGATGSIGAACARVLAREVKNLTLAARNEQRLEQLAQELHRDCGCSARTTSQVKTAVRSADVIIAVTSALDTIIEPEDLKPGAIVCDVARPRNVSRQVAEKRNDVLVIEGGVVEVPGEVDFGLNFGFPERTSYACMAETIILALEGRYEPFTLGRELSVAQIETISALADKHGFKLAGFRSFERAITEREIETIRANAKLAQKCRLGEREIG